MARMDDLVVAEREELQAGYLLQFGVAPRLAEQFLRAYLSATGEQLEDEDGVGDGDDLQLCSGDQLG